MAECEGEGEVMTANLREALMEDEVLGQGVVLFRHEASKSNFVRVPVIGLNLFCLMCFLQERVLMDFALTEAPALLSVNN